MAANRVITQPAKVSLTPIFVAVVSPPDTIALVFQVVLAAVDFDPFVQLLNNDGFVTATQGHRQ